jgi:hypothetical protein
MMFPDVLFLFSPETDFLTHMGILGEVSNSHQMAEIHLWRQFSGFFNLFHIFNAHCLQSLEGGVCHRVVLAGIPNSFLDGSAMTSPRFPSKRILNRL